MNENDNCTLIVTQYLESKLEIDDQVYTFKLENIQRGPGYPRDISYDSNHSWRTGLDVFPYRWERKGHRPHYIGTAGSTREEAIARLREVLLHYISKYDK